MAIKSTMAKSCPPKVEKLQSMCFSWRHVHRQEDLASQKFKQVQALNPSTSPCALATAGSKNDLA